MNTLKKLIKDCCTKTDFSFTNVIYKQKDGVFVSYFLGPLLVTVIMTELDMKIL